MGWEVLRALAADEEGVVLERGVDGVEEAVGRLGGIVANDCSSTIERIGGEGGGRNRGGRAMEPMAVTEGKRCDFRSKFALVVLAGTGRRADELAA